MKNCPFCESEEVPDEAVSCPTCGLRFDDSSAQKKRMRKKRASASAPTAQPNVVYVAQPKSVGLAFLLTLLFGPLGMLYSTVSGGLIMLVVSVVAAWLTCGASLFITWPVCVVWGCVAASQGNGPANIDWARVILGLVIVGFLGVAFLATRNGDGGRSETRGLDRGSSDRSSPDPAVGPGPARPSAPPAPPPWFCACITERDDESIDGSVTVTVCRPTEPDCEGIERRARRGTDTLLGLEAACTGFDGSSQPALPLLPDEALEPSSRAGGWQLRGRCALP